MNNPEHSAQVSLASHLGALHGPLMQLASLRDALLVYWRCAPGLDEGAVACWCSDAEEAYNAALRAARLLEQSSPDATGLEEACTYVQARLECVGSELRTRTEPAALELSAAWQRHAQTVLTQLVQSMRERRDQDPATHLSLEHADLVRQIQVMRTDKERFELFCSVCGRRAAAFEVGESPLRAQPSLLYESSLRRQSFRLPLAHAVFAALGDKQIGRAHDVLMAHGACRTGIDAWCPDCRAVYCSDHYSCADTYDEGFYDATHATCPQGHRRRVAD